MGWSVFQRVRAVLDAVGGAGVATSASQVAFRRRRGFAWLWLPGRYLRGPPAEVVLSIALGRRDPSPRWKEVAHPSWRHWVHHLEVGDPADIDDEVARWWREAADRPADRPTADSRRRRLVRPRLASGTSPSPAPRTADVQRIPVLQVVALIGVAVALVDALRDTGTDLALLEGAVALVQPAVLLSGVRAGRPWPCART